MDRKTRIFIFAYYSFKDPVFQSAVLPYFIDFPDGDQFQFILLTFEQREFRMDHEEVNKSREFLLARNIHWVKTKWHSGSFKVLKKIYDLVMGFFLSQFLILKWRPCCIYAEGFPGAIISYILSVINRLKHIVHTFEPHADYMVEGGIWKKDDWEVWVLKKFESKIARQAYKIYTATDAYKARIVAEWGVRPVSVDVVPSCVDTAFFSFDRVSRIRLRKELGISSNERIVTYLGKFGGMYMERELFHFFKVCKQNELDSLRFRFFILTAEDPIKIQRWVQECGLDLKDFFISKLDRNQVPAYLSASDIGVVAVRPFPSKRFCSPIKDGEYWSCGLPIVIPVGVSDDYLLTKQNNLGVVLEDMSDKSYLKAAGDINRLLHVMDKDKRSEIAEFARINRDKSIFQRKLLQVFSSV